MSGRWIALGSLAVLAAGLATAFVHSRRPVLPAEPPPGVEEVAIEQALKQLPGGAEHTDRYRWVDEIPGIDVADLGPERREIFIRFANAQRCTCGCGYTLAGCRVYDSTCEVSLPLVEALLDSVRAGHIRTAEGIRPLARAAAASVDR